MIKLNLEELHEACEPIPFLDAEKKSIDDETKKSITEIIDAIKNEFNLNSEILAISAPQVGFNKRIFALRFDDKIKFFINPVITKKEDLIIIPEKFSSMPGKEILIARPSNIRCSYIDEEFKYQTNTFKDYASFLFDQMYNLLDGVTPDLIGLVSDPETDGSLYDLSEDDFKEICDYYLNYIQNMSKTLNESIQGDDELSSQYRQLQFAEKVIYGKASIVDQEAWKTEKAHLRKQKKFEKSVRSTQFKNFAARRHK